MDPSTSLLFTRCNRHFFAVLRGVSSFLSRPLRLVVRAVQTPTKKWFEFHFFAIIFKDHLYFSSSALGRFLPPSLRGTRRVGKRKLRNLLPAKRMGTLLFVLFFFHGKSV